MAENRTLFGGLNIRTKLIVVLVTVSLVPLAVVGWFSLVESEASISAEVFNRLVSARDGKNAQIVRLLKKAHADIRVLAGSSHIDAALDAFSAVVRDGEIDRRQFDFFESLEYGGSFRRFIEEYDYYDLMLVTDSGDIVYSTKREADFAQNVLIGALKDSLLGRSFKQGIKKVVMTDFQIYPPSNGQVMSFLIAPIGESGATAGAVVLKMTNAVLNDVMLERVGMGRTGEAYLVGPDNLMRSDSFLDPVNRSVSASFRHPHKGKVDTAASRAALKGQKGRQIIIDYRGEEVLSAYQPLKFGDFLFALMVEVDKNEAFKPIDNLRRLVLILALVMVALMFLSAFLIANIITQPILSLTRSSLDIAGGDLDRVIRVVRDDELGVLSNNFNKMRLSIRSKIQEVEDSREALRRSNETLEERVEERTAELTEASAQISSSIEYASNIQKSLLPDEKTFRSALGDHFVAWEPKDVVGGDFYWVRDWAGGHLLILGDCTGHGVPGAFMTLIATATLNRSLRETPSGRLDELMSSVNGRIKTVLGENADGSMSDDGMDVGMVFFEDNRDAVWFCGAGISLFAKHAEEINEFKGTRHGVGFNTTSTDQDYNVIKIAMSNFDAFYLVSDGVFDQTGGERGHGYGKRRFKEAVMAADGQDFLEQKASLLGSIRAYQGDHPRRDDMTIIGFGASGADD